jgi:putative ABC transport system permease protein
VSGPELPRLVVWLLTRAVPDEWRDSIAGDLEEERRRRLASGRYAGTAWIVGTTIRLVTRLRMERRTSVAPTQAGREGHTTGNGRTFDLDGVWADGRYAVRGLVASPGYTAMAILALALGIGANGAVFNLTNWLLLRSVPGLQHQERLVTVNFGEAGATGPVSVPAVNRLATGIPALAAVAGYQSVPLHVAPSVGGPPRRIDAEIVSGNYFDVLGGPLARGRGFSPDEGRLASLPPVVVVSDRFWRDDLGRSADVIGRAVVINGEPWTIVGVATRGFHGPSRSGSADLWVPVTQHQRVLPGYPNNVLTSLKARVFFGVVGRLAPGGTVALVTTQAETVRRSLLADLPGDFQLKRFHFTAVAGVEARPWVRDRLSRSMTLLTGVVSLLLVLTCANVGNLLLARATGRRAEIATRMALGASRLRIARLLLVESLLLSMAAGGVALVLAALVGRLLAGTIVLQGLPPLDRVELDWHVFAFALAAATLVALAAGVVPAISGSRFDVQTALREAGRSQTAGRGRIRRVLTVAQVAVSLTLLVGALLLVRSMAMRRAIDPGFDPSHVLAFSVEPRLQGYDKARQVAFYRDLLARVRDQAGVRSAGLAWLQPYSQGAADQEVRAADQPETTKVDADYNVVSPGFFDALNLSLIQGRDFTDAEAFRPANQSAGSVIISESLARTLFGQTSAVGRQIVLASDDDGTRTVVGIVRDTRQRRLVAPPPHMIFEPMSEAYAGWATVLVNVGAPPETIVPALRRAVMSIDPTLPIYDVTTLRAAIEKQLADDILVTRLTTTFALLATLLAAVGLYSVLARGVAERRREFSIRVALGAGPAMVARLVTGEALRVTAIGLGCGLVATYWLARLLDSRLFGVQRFDPWACGGGVVLTLAISLIAALAPAHRAARVDPAAELK